MRLGSVALDLAFPLRCAGCDREPPAGGPFCEACKTGLAPVGSPRCTVCGEPFARLGADHPCARCLAAPPPFRIARAPFLYGGPLGDAVRRMKYAGRPDLARVLAPLMLPEARSLGGDVVVPVPLSRGKLWSRGYNQAALLAWRVARALRLRLDTRSLRRARDGPAQAGRARTARFEEVRGAFEARGRRVEGLQVLLVDDVLTTGATASAATRALQRAGAADVAVLTLARAGEP